MEASFLQSLIMLLSPESGVWAIVGLSLMVSISALVISAVLGLAITFAITLYQYPLRGVVLLIAHTLLGIPPVVVGLLVYLLFSHTGPLGFADLLFTPTAMIVAQVVLVLPIIVAYGHDILSEAWQEYQDHLSTLGARRDQIALILLHDRRYQVALVLLNGFGRAISEVGAVLIVGGNILHHTRVMTSAITLFTSQGNLMMAIALGLILLTIGLVITLLVLLIRWYASQQEKYAK